MSGRLRTALVILVAMLLFAGAGIAASQAEIVQHWALYASSGPGKPFHLFLDPFPDEKTCQVDSRAIIGSGGRAYCAAHAALTFDRTGENRLLWEFLSPANPWSRLCRAAEAR